MYENGEKAKSKQGSKKPTVGRRQNESEKSGERRRGRAENGWRVKSEKKKMEEGRERKIRKRQIRGVKRGETLKKEEKKKGDGTDCVPLSLSLLSTLLPVGEPPPSLLAVFLQSSLSSP
ncbi:hypothetical protein H6P81_011740 [Aristolochia fimbriata]|uniref:Uncharacterized protein n=1 Tax=Aristolochia fimbriata TaxID=158543 RepID=A0AAV7E9U0_ARIFI|nr:hypothetical protein H6P81_011740 [Aristolochia fimbriata]